MPKTGQIGQPLRDGVGRFGGSRRQHRQQFINPPNPHEKNLNATTDKRRAATFTRDGNFQ